jgi:hypothetical protein
MKNIGILMICKAAKRQKQIKLSVILQEKMLSACQVRCQIIKMTF